MQGSTKNGSGLRARTGVVDQGSAVHVQGTKTLAVAAMATLGSGHTGVRQGSGHGSQNTMKGTEGA